MPASLILSAVRAQFERSADPLNFSSNRLVSGLSKPLQKLLLSASTVTDLCAWDVIGAPTLMNETVYFLAGASVAQLVPRGRDLDVAVGLIPAGGTAGLQFALGAGPGQFTLLVQTGGPAFALEGATFRRILSEHPPVLLAVARQMWAEAQDLAMFAMSLHSHSVTQRLANWIRLSGHGNATGELDLTHAHMARMLGVRRASVSEAAYELRRMGLVDYVRGKVRVLDASGLESYCSAA